ACRGPLLGDWPRSIRHSVPLSPRSLGGDRHIVVCTPFRPGSIMDGDTIVAGKPRGKGDDAGGDAGAAGRDEACMGWQQWLQDRADLGNRAHVAIIHQALERQIASPRDMTTAQPRAGLRGPAVEAVRRASIEYAGSFAGTGQQHLVAIRYLFAVKTRGEVARWHRLWLAVVHDVSGILPGLEPAIQYGALVVPHGLQHPPGPWAGQQPVATVDDHHGILIHPQPAHLGG